MVTSFFYLVTLFSFSDKYEMNDTVLQL